MTNFDVVKKRTKKLEKLEKKGRRNKWWVIKYKKYTVPIYLLPLALILIPFYELKERYILSLSWSNEKAKKVIEKTLRKKLKWDEEEDVYYIYINKFGGTIFNTKSPWQKKFRYDLREELLETYEHENYIKKVEEDYDWWYITFTEK